MNASTKLLINPGDALSYMSMLAPPNLSVATTTFLSDIFNEVVFIVAFLQLA